MKRRAMTPESHVIAVFSMLPEPFSSDMEFFAMTDSVHAGLRRRTLQWLRQVTNSKRRTPQTGLEDDLTLFRELD